MNVSFPKTRRARVMIWSVFWIIAILGISEFSISRGYPWKFSRLEPYLLRSEKDDYVHVAFEIQRIRERSDPSVPLFIFIGSSSAHEAIDTGRAFEEIYEAKTGKRIELISVCSASMSFSDQAKVIEAIGRADATFLIGIDPLMFTYDPGVQLEEIRGKGRLEIKHFYLTPPSSTVRTLSAYGYTPDVKQRLYLIRTVTILTAMLRLQLAHIFKTGGELSYLTYDSHVFRENPPVSPDDRVRYAGLLMDKYSKLYRNNHRLNRDLFSAEIDIAMDNGNKVILIDLPFNPLFDREMGTYYPHYDTMIRELVREKGIGYIDTRKAADWSPDDFVDVHHMRVFGRVKFTETLAAILSNNAQ